MKVKKYSLRKLINQNCKDCIYDPLAGGTWRQQVEQCPCKVCALYPVRPVAKKQRIDDKSEEE